MSLKFDIRCTCAGCGLGIPHDGQVLASGAHKISETTVKGGKEVIAQVSKACPACSSLRVRIRTTATVGGL